jgi:hypothetical protein
MVEYVFIVPYRDREEHKHFFDRYIKYILEDYDPSTYEIIFSHQNNNLPFNRGAMKNIGFLYAKEKYPNYKDINFVFNDIDTMPHKKGLLNYSVKKNEIKHYYGFNFALGGIFSIKGGDFEKIDGFPNLWSWGYEDNAMLDRAIKNEITINRDQFYPIFNKNILHIVDEYSKNISLKNKAMYEGNTMVDGLSTLKKVNYRFNTETGLLDVSSFDSLYDPNDPTLVSNMMRVANIKKNTLKTLKFL